MAPYFLEIIFITLEINTNKNEIHLFDFFLFNGIFVNGSLNFLIIAVGFYYKEKRRNNYYVDSFDKNFNSVGSF